ncbi:hypothetical protein NKG95_31540 [Mesorhizobium sp. M1423]|uniref:hypothetical protein n=1 Tax=Mesorhizobium sp. M1423 TaxID=2957101 RepID=UPI003334AE12
MIARLARRLYPKATAQWVPAITRLPDYAAIPSDLDHALEADGLQFQADRMEQFGVHRLLASHFSQRTFARTWSMVTLPMTSRSAPQTPTAERPA